MITITFTGETREDLRSQMETFLYPKVKAETSIVSKLTPACSHGDRKWREGFKGGDPEKPYAGWYCVSPNRAEQCPPMFPKAKIPADRPVNWTQQSEEM